MVRRESASNSLRDALDNINRDLGWWEGDTDEISEHWAFDRWQGCRSALSRFEIYRASALDDAPTEALKDAVVSRLKSLIECLDDIHRPASTHQHDDDHDIPDDEWGKIEARGVAARAEVPEKYGATLNSLQALEQAYDNLANTIRAKLVAVDEALMTG
jgi:hypothetical protein